MCWEHRRQHSDAHPSPNPSRLGAFARTVTASMQTGLQTLFRSRNLDYKLWEVRRQHYREQPRQLRFAQQHERPQGLGVTGADSRPSLASHQSSKEPATWQATYSLCPHFLICKGL